MALFFGNMAGSVRPVPFRATAKRPLDGGLGAKAKCEGGVQAVCGDSTFCSSPVSYI